MLNLTNNLYDNQQKQNELKQVDTKKNLSLVASDVLDSTRQQVKQYTGTDNYSVKELSLIAGAMSASNDKKRTAVKVSTALDISKAEGVDFDTAYNNLDAYAKMYADESGEWTPAFGEKVKGYVKQGSLSGKLIDLQQQWHDIDLADGDTTEIESQIESVQNEMATISKYTPNNIVEKFLQLAGNNWQYMTKIGLESASAGMAATMLASVMASAAGVGKGVAIGSAGGPLGMAIGGTAGLLSSGIALATIYGAGATAQGVKATYDWSKPGMYYELRKRGVSKETAEYVATGSGLTEGMIETLFEGTIFANYLGKMTATKNIAGAMGDTVNNGALKNITNRIAAALHLSGASEAWLYAGMKLASDFTIEGAQETFEGLSNDGFKAIALSLEGIPAKKEDFETVKERYDEFIGGGLLSLGLGLPFAYGTKFKFQNKIDTDASTLSAWQYVKSLKDEAQQNPSKQWFIERHEEDGFIDQDLSTTEKREMLAQIYDKNHKTIEEQQTTRAELETIDTADNLNENFEAGNIDEEGNQIEAEASPILPEPKRMEDGRLRTQTSDKVRQNADGTETHIFKIGTADSGKRYGYIEYTIDDNNKAINIDRVAMAKGQEKLTKESILELEQQWEGWDFNWNPASEAQIKVKNELLTDPLNENQGKLNWYNAKTDVDANIQLARELNKAFPNITKEESLVGVRLMEFSAQAEGLTTKEWLNRRVQQFAVSNDKESRGFINLDKNTLEAVVYVGEHGNFSTLAHEVFHAGIVQTKYSKQLKDALQEAAETPEFKAYLDSHQRLTHMETEKAIEAIKTMSDNVKEWNEAQDEITATLFESYLHDGKTFSDKLKAIFRKIADLFHNIYKGLKASGTLNDNIIKAYDAILTENPEFAKMVEQDTTQNNSVTLKQSLDYDSIEQELKANPNNFDKDGNHLAPNGKKSNLTYEQWITVRTPKFKNWFGDWENDPQNASKMIDKNGEPLVCYHGSRNSFDTFAKNMIGSSNDMGFFGEGFYFTFQNWEENGKAAKLEASFYGSNVYDVFLNIRNPFDFSTLYDFSLNTENQDNMYAFLYNIAKKYPELSSQISMPSTETPIDEFGYEYELNELSPKEYIEKIDNLLKNPPLKEVTYNKETKPVYGYWNTEKNQSAGYTYDTKEELHASYSNTLLNTLNLYLPAYTSHELIMGTNFSEVIKKQGYDGIIQSKTGDEVIAFESNQIKSATDNNGDFNPNNKSIRFQQLDNEYFDAIENNDMEAAQKIVEEVAKEKGYSTNSDYQGTSAFNGSAPGDDWGHTKEERKQMYNADEWDGGNATLGDYKNGVDPNNLKLFLTNSNMIRDNFMAESASNIRKGLNDGEITMYRSVPKSVKESKFRNGDWITPSKKYAIDNAAVHGWEEEYRIIEQKVPIDYIWWDGNDINEWGYDDGQSYAYKNTENNVKLFDTIVKDENGNIIPPSQRFNQNNSSIRYQKLDDYMYEYTFADARRKDTLEEFLDYELSLNGQEIFDDIKDELVEMWKEAHGVSDKPVPTLAELSASEDSKDETMKAFVSTDEGVINFMKRWQDAYKMRNHAAYGGIDVYYDAEERRYVDQVSQAVDNFSSDASQFMKAIAISKKELTPETIKKVRTTINNEPRLYRDLFAQLTGDKNLQVKYFTDTVQDINDPRFVGLNITEKRKLVNRLKGEQIRADIMSGKEKVEGNVELAINSYEADIKDLNTKLEATQKELNYTTYDLNKQQKANLNMLNEQRILNRQIANLERTIRNKLDNGHKIDESLAKELNDKNDRLSLINEEVKAIREQDKEKAAAKLQEKLDNLKKEIRQKELEKAALQEVHQYKKDLHTSILAPISSNVDHEYAKKIKAVQAIVAGASGYQNDNITYDGKKYTLNDFRAKVDSGEIKVEGLSDYQLKRYLNTSLADLTVGDLEQLKDTRDYYENRGRQMWQAKVDDRNYRLKQQRAELYNTILENSRFDKTKNVAGSEEDRERRNSALNKLRLIFYKTLNMDSKAQVIGNDSENSLAYKLMVTDYYKHEDNKALNLARREDPLFALKDELGINNKDLYDPIEINLSTKFGDKIQSFTPSQLAYIYYSQFNEQNKAAVSYGVLASDEKTDIVRAYNGKETLANQELQALGDARYERALQQATEYFNEHPEIKQFIDAVFAELQTRGDALNQLMIDMWNQEIELVGSYLPMFRKSEDNTEVEGQILNNLMNGPAVGKVQTSPNRGMTKSRIDMSPLHQTPVNMDYIGIAFRAIEQQEHLLEYAEYIRDMNALFKGRGSRDIRLGIENIGGQGLLQDVDNFLNETANPYYTNDVQGINPLINTFRGNLYAGYLGVKISGMILQMITSPTAFLQYVTPLELAGGLLKMTRHPKRTMEIINENSIFMKNRSIDPTIEMLKKAAQQKDTLQASLIEKETILLEVADSWAVYGGWSAVFNRKLNELGEDTDANIKAAAEYADYVVRKTQPDADQARIAPLFKSGNAATKALLQFQTSLNVIWNQVAYNIDKTFNTFKNPNATKELKKQVFKDTMGVMVTYALAGVILEAVKRKGDDDDDWKDVVRDLAYGATTQFTSAIPITGNYLDRINKIAITGEKGYNFQSTMFPVLDKITSGIESGIEVGTALLNGESKKDFEKKLKRALWNIGEGVALFKGLPVSGFKELGYTVTKDGFKESLINNDFDFTFNPGALLGKRDY